MIHKFLAQLIPFDDMPLLHLETHGNVPDEETRNMLALFEECYGRLKPKELDLVEIVLFENDRLWHSYIGAERGRAGAMSADFDDRFIAVHEAWTGIPRVSVSLERKHGVTQLVWEGALRHEVGHSILHGGLEYYIFPVPKALVKSAENFPTLAPYLTDLLYLLALTVKDLEVTKLLVSSGYIDDQEAYARYLMKPDEQDLDAWALASIAAQARVLCLVGRMKDIAAGTVLALSCEGSQVQSKEIEESINYLPEQLRTVLLDTMTEVLRGLSDDTSANVETAGGILAAKVIQPVMRSHSHDSGS